MTDKERRSAWLQLFIALAAVVLLCLLMAGCKTTRHTATHDTVYVDRVRTEYQWRHDSIYTDRWHDRWLQGDTVYMRDSVVCYRWHTLTDTLTMHDSVYISKSDTTTVEVAKPLSKFVRGQIVGFWLLLFSVLAVVVLWCVKKFYLHK